MTAEEDFPATREWMERRRARLEAEIAAHTAPKADLTEQIFRELRTLNIILYARTWPFQQPKVEEEIKNRLGL